MSASNKIGAVYKEGDECKYPRMITIVSKHNCVRLMINEIELIEQEGRMLHIVTADKDYCICESMKSIAPILNPKNFYRPLSALIVNFDHVKEIDGQFINFESGQSASMGKNNISKTKTAFRKYLRECAPYGYYVGGIKVAEPAANQKTE